MAAGKRALLGSRSGGAAHEGGKHALAGKKNKTFDKKLGGILGDFGKALSLATAPEARKAAMLRGIAASLNARKKTNEYGNALCDTLMQMKSAFKYMREDYPLKLK